MLEDDGHRPWPKLTGGKGLHMMVPVAPRLTHHRARSYCKVLAQKPAVSAPKRYALSPEPNEICARVADWREFLPFCGDPSDHDGVARCSDLRVALPRLRCVRRQSPGTSHAGTAACRRQLRRTL
jgi:hypothetical protein